MGARRTDASPTLEFLAAVVECSDDAIITKDLNGVVTSWNNSAERIFGYTAEEMIGQSISILAEERIESIDLNLVFRKVLENCKATIDESSASVTSDYLPRVNGYEPHFVQLFQNLISNALKYRGERTPRIHFPL